MALPQLVEVTLAGGVGYVVKAAWDFFAKRQDAKTPEAKQAFQLTHTSGQVDLLARINAELESDNDRLRKILHETEDRAEAQRQQWIAERYALTTEVDTLRAKVIDLVKEMDVLQSRLKALTESYGD